MNRELLKKNYMTHKIFDTEDKRKDREENYVAHHIAFLDETLMENQENCILLKKEKDIRELLDYQEYVHWLMKQDRFNELKTTDIKVVKETLKSIKKAIKNESSNRELKEVLESIRG